MPKKQRVIEIKDLKNENKDLKEQLQAMKKENGTNSNSVELETIKKALEIKENMFKVLLVERDNALKALDEEKRNHESLQEKVVELQKIIEETSKEKTELDRSDSLRKQNDIVDLMSVLKTTLESVETNQYNGLTMIQNMSSLISGIENNYISKQTQEKGQEENKKEFENSVEKELEIALVNLSQKEKLVEQLLREKDELFDVEKNVTNELTKTCEKLSFVEVERDDALKALDEEKRNQVVHKEKMVEFEKMIESTSKELEKFKSEQEKLIKENKELENRSDSLSTLQNNIVELQKEVETAKTKANHDLAMIKSVCSLVCGLEDKTYEEEENGMEHYSDAIKKAFENNEKMIEGLVVEKNSIKKEIELLEKSLREKDELVEVEKNVAEQLRNDLTKTTEKLSELNDALARLEVDKDNVLDEEKRNQVSLKEKIVELEKMFETTDKERERLITKMNELENSMKKEIELLEESLREKDELVEVEKNVAEQLRNDLTKTTEKLSELNDALALLEVEKDNALDEEKRNQVALKENIVELEKMFEATDKERERLITEVNELENSLKKEMKLMEESLQEKDEHAEVELSQLNDLTKTTEKLSKLNDVLALLEVDKDKALDEEKINQERLIKEMKELKKEKSLLQKDIAELQRVISVLKTELEDAKSNANQSLTMLKTMSSLLPELQNKIAELTGEKRMDSY